MRVKDSLPSEKEYATNESKRTMQKIPNLKHDNFLLLDGIMENVVDPVSILHSKLAEFKNREGKSQQKPKPFDSDAQVDGAYVHLTMSPKKSCLKPKNSDQQSIFVVIPRRKRNTLGNERVYFTSAPAIITPALLQSVAGLSLPQAARSIGISATSFKHACRHFGIQRWEYKRGRGKQSSTVLKSGEAAATVKTFGENPSMEEGEGTVESRGSESGQTVREREEGLIMQPALAEDWLQRGHGMRDWPEGFVAEPATEANDRLVLAMLARPWAGESLRRAE